MEHYDGPAFYRKYNIKDRNTQIKHTHKTKRTESDDSGKSARKLSDVDRVPFVDNKDNPIAKRTAAFKPSKTQTKHNTRAPYYKITDSTYYNDLFKQLKRDTSELIALDNNDEGAIDLDSDESFSDENSDSSNYADTEDVSTSSVDDNNDYDDSNRNENQDLTDQSSEDSESDDDVTTSEVEEHEDHTDDSDNEEEDNESDTDSNDNENNEVENDPESVTEENSDDTDDSSHIIAAEEIKHHDQNDNMTTDNPIVMDNDEEEHNTDEDDNNHENDSANVSSGDNSDSHGLDKLIHVAQSSNDEPSDNIEDESNTSDEVSDSDNDHSEDESNEPSDESDNNVSEEHDEKQKRKSIDQHGLGHSLSSILNQENSAQKDLSLFNDDNSKNEQPEHLENISSDFDDRGYKFPSLDLLSPADTTDDEGMDDWIADQAEKLDETLQAFHVDANVVDWTNGPTVTQFQIKLQLGVKVSKITNLTDDLKLALAAKDIRIEAPIPGKTTVGIEIPNPHPRPVKLAEVLDSPQFKQSTNPLTVALGVDLTGQPKVTDLNKMPHGLIAGATGSGKSVFLNSMLISLLYKATPAQLKMILIDPKAVEMAPYNGLPHLLSPVISDPKQASAALKWAVKEMDERYEKLAASGARNIEQFNKLAEEHGEYAMKMPYIVIVIDELADLMMVASNEVQDYIVRITQKARAAGIHLIVATQRPSVDIITGTIKNNIPTRVAFMVSSQVDSRTIIDTAGAERLLGKGDMLYLGNGASQSVRLQGTFVTNDEIERIIDEVKKRGKPKYAFQPDSLLKSVNQVEQQDELMPDVLEYISQEDTVSTSKLQRVFSIGYNRAASLIDELEKHNYVSGQHGSKPRDVYLTESDYKKLNI